jgi:hypothetical protein
MEEEDKEKLDRVDIAHTMLTASCKTLGSLVASHRYHLFYILFICLYIFVYIYMYVYSICVYLYLSSHISIYMKPSGQS